MGSAAVVATIANLLSVAIEALQAATAASAVLKQAQDETWTDVDPRWQAKFDELDAMLDKAKARLT